MKYGIKVGMEFEGLKITIENEKESTFHDWKNLSVLLVFLTLVIGVAYATFTGNMDIFNKTVDAVVAASTPRIKMENGKEK